MDRLDVGQIGDVGGDAYDVCDLAARSLDHFLDVLPGLPGLCLRVTGADDPQLLVERHLAGDEECVPDPDPVRVRPGQRMRPSLGRDHLLPVAHSMYLRSIVTAAQ